MLRHEAREDLRCRVCGKLGPWRPGERCRGEAARWYDRDRIEARQQEATDRYHAALEAHDALGGTPLTLEERLTLRISCGP